ncbi:PREDICTED: cation channel sperm-associated protein 1 [Dipodomys ordii]|uniref:Cation channel sperm-associated protein 1 n=1 Tax=Dipodomys ordii TaxID=10020 RepID=A0A1S3FJZ0_DIPOR|nr:PREDICTED: cation channel sperm-associated protein 1 [Dipodomys ordii]
MDQSPKAADASARPQRPSVHTGSFLGVQDPAVRAHPGGGLSPSSGLDLRRPSRVFPTGFSGGPHGGPPEHPPGGEPQAKEEAGREGLHAKLPSRERPAISQAAISQAFLPKAHPSITPSAMRFRDSLQSAGPSRVTILSRSSRGSSKVHPQFTTKESETWQDEEKTHKRKLGRIPRIHKKIHAGSLVQQILDKICAILGTLRIMTRSLTYSLGFETIIFLFVCLNTIMLVAQTFAELEIRGEWYFLVFDSIFLCIYVLEALLKIIALGLEYFIDPWNNLDFFIMIMAVLEFVFIQINSLTYSFYNHSIFRILKVFKSLRALRALRVLRRLSILTSLHEVTGTLARTLPSITAILILMFTCLFLFSVVLRALFRHSDPKRFQSILTTIFTLFTLLTLDDWSLIYLDSRAQGAWYIIPILMIYIIIQYFIFLNLVIAVLVDNFQMALLRNLEKVKQEKAAQIHEKLLDDSLTELKQAENEEIKNSIALGKEFIERKFGTMTEKQQELQFQFLQLVAAVEQHQQKFRSQASVIDEIVDIAFEAGEEDFTQ